MSRHLILGSVVRSLIVFLFSLVVIGLGHVSPLMADPAPIPEAFILRDGYKPAVSGDGKWVAFECNNRWSLCLADTDTRVTEVLHTVENPYLGGDILQDVDISRDGMVISFWLRPIPSDETLYVYDRHTSSLELIFVNSDGDRATYNGSPAQNPSAARLSGDGRYVLFSTNANNLAVGDTNGRYDLFIRDRDLGTTTLVGMPNGGGQADGNNGEWGKPATLSSDGTKAVFYSEAENLTSGDIQDDEPPYEYENADVFYLDLTTGSISRMSEVPQSFEGGDGTSLNATISPNGQRAAFYSNSENFTTTHSGSQTNIYIFDPTDGSLAHVNRPLDGITQYDTSLGNTQMDFNFDGSILYFSSYQDNLVVGDAPDLIPNPNNPSLPPTVRASRDIFAFSNGNLERIRPIVEGEEVRGWWPSTNDLGDVVAFSTGEIVNGTSAMVGVMKRGDIVGPNIVALQRIPNGEVGTGVVMDLIGLANDVSRGNTDIIRAEYQIDSEGAWMPFPARDGVFDNELEELRAFVDTAPLELGAHTVCARATDAALQTGPESCLEFEVVGVASPEQFLLLCQHEPLFPQPGETVVITANTFVPDPLGGTPSTFSPVERLEIWYNDQSEPVDVNDYFGTATNTFTTEALDEEGFSYGCRGILGGKAVFSGWRTVQVGSSDPSAPISVIYTGPSTDRIDVVFVADEDSYSGSDDPDFLAAAQDFIVRGFYLYPFYNQFQHLFNFWISKNTGAAYRESSSGDSEKSITKPVDWEENYAFSDSGGVIHTDSFRDFARNGMFTVEPGSFRTMRHEVGHRPFGLSDEYCCDSSYYQTEIHPNVYTSLLACEEDAPNLGRDPSQCRAWTSELNETEYYSSEPNSDDLMRNNTIPNEADIRRVEWMFDKCLAGLC